MKKILSILGNILLVVVILIAVLMTFASLNTNENGLPEIGGYMVMNIQSGSMEPTIMTGDLIITKEISDKRTIKKGDVVSFVQYEDDTPIIVTHRITAVNDNFGDISYTTKGDSNKTVDEKNITPSAIVAKYDGFRIPILGYIFSFLSGRLGFFIFIILPLFALFVYQLYKFITAIIEDKKQELIAKIKDEEANKEK